MISVFSCSWSNPTIPSNFSALYTRHKVSQILFDLTSHFQLNSLIIGLEDRTTSLGFHNCDFSECMKNALHTNKFVSIPAHSFLALIPVETFRPSLLDNIEKINKKVQSSSPKTIDLVARQTSLPVLIGSLLKVLEIKAGISAKVQGSVSVYLKSADALEVLAWLFMLHSLEIRNSHGVFVVAPDYFTP
ncbi:MAG: hypothetical protein H3C47_02980 [Candidatus Cloacimonetes bacterium]|nr:hypothetical protein [Candidatus Cloacimonadota bacterium]